MTDMSDNPDPADPADPSTPDLDAAIRRTSRWNGVSDFSEDDEPLAGIVAATERGFQVVTGQPYDVEELIRRTPGLAEKIARQLREPRVRWGRKPRRPR